MSPLWLLTLFTVCCVVWSAPSSSSCPDTCECSTLDTVTTTRCFSLSFVAHTSVETLNHVAHLDVRASNLTKLAALRKLRGVKSVNVAHNALRHLVDLRALTKLAILNLRDNQLKLLSEEDLPKNLEHLDVSANQLTDFPSFRSMRRLREVNLAENPFPCGCELQAKCESLRMFVHLLKPVTCRDSGGHLHLVSELACARNPSNDLDTIQNDMEGSGDDVEAIEEEVGHPRKLADMRNEELLPTATSKPVELTDADYEDNGEEEEYDQEGSGESAERKVEDEGSGSNDLILPTTEETPLKACNFDCSTPLTLAAPESHNSTEPDPSLLDEVGKVFQDIFSTGEDDEESEEASGNETVSEAPITPVIAPKSGEGRSVHVEIPEEKAHSASEVKEASNPFGLSNNLIVIIALVIVMVCIIIYTILSKRRRKASRRGLTGNGGPGEEMKVIESVRPTKPTPTIETTTDGGLPEKVPLMNGEQNGSGVITPLISDEDGVQMRSPRSDHSPLLVDAHRVTIQVKELTTPKTPLLVTRVRSHDGQIITTPETNQHY